MSVVETRMSVYTDQKLPIDSYKKIESIFDRVYDGAKNPMTSNVIGYGQIHHLIFEVSWGEFYFWELVEILTGKKAERIIYGLTILDVSDPDNVVKTDLGTGGTPQEIKDHLIDLYKSIDLVNLN